MIPKHSVDISGMQKMIFGVWEENIEIFIYIF